MKVLYYKGHTENETTRSTPFQHMEIYSRCSTCCALARAQGASLGVCGGTCIAQNANGSSSPAADGWRHWIKRRRVASRCANRVAVRALTAARMAEVTRRPAVLPELLWLRSCFWLSFEGEVSLLYHAGASGHVKL